MENKNSTKEILELLTSHMETIEDPTTIADVAIAAVMVLVKRLMCQEVEDE